MSHPIVRVATHVVQEPLIADRPPQYVGYRHPRVPHRVTVLCVPQGIVLPPRNDARNHSPDGFEWGYAGSGPAQLALALLLHATEDRVIAESLYQHFKRVVIASINVDHWAILRADVRAWVRSHRPGQLWTNGRGGDECRDDDTFSQ